MTPIDHFPAHTCGCACGRNPTALETLLINLLTQSVMASLDEIQSSLTEVRSQLEKVRAENTALRDALNANVAAEVARNTELLAKVAELEAALAAANPPDAKVAAIADAVAGIRTFLADFDADVPDAAPPA